MPTTKQLMEAFQEMGGRSSLDLKNGLHYEGYVFEVCDGHMVFGVGGPLAPDEPALIPLEEIDLDTLSYWDEVRGCWVDARYNESHAAWSHTPYRPPARGRGSARPWWKFWA